MTWGSGGQPRPGTDAPTPSVDANPRDEARGPVASRRAIRWRLFVILALTIPIVDQIVKAWIVGNLELGRPVDIVGDSIRLVLVHNNGGLFGLFSGQAQIFAAVSLVVVGIIIWYESQVGVSLLATLALGLLLGGAFGNLVDRLRLGFVVDFVDTGLGAFRWYTFNVADAAISTSIVLLLLLALIGDSPETRPAWMRRGRIGRLLGAAVDGHAAGTGGEGGPASPNPDGGADDDDAGSGSLSRGAGPDRSVAADNPAGD